MSTRIAILILLFVSITVACRPRGEGRQDPANPSPVAPPSGETNGSPQPRHSGKGSAGGSGASNLPGRADEAPLVRVREALGEDGLLGRRVRVSGHCTAAGAGRRAGSWTLEDAGTSIEVRGLVPSSCAVKAPTELTIFAQIEPTRGGSQDRLLLRLPD
jgi:hypothetical protein